MANRAVMALGLAVMLSGVAHADDRCPLGNLGGGTVQAALDGRTVLLVDGREVRLAGIEVQAEATAALRALAEGRAVTLGGLGVNGAEADRYGRLLAVIFLESARFSIENSLQAELLARGLARVAARAGTPGCARSLLAAEHKARLAGLGLWRNPAYLARSAKDFDAILALKGRFAVVEGKVLSVRESGSTIYVNFGRRWSEDFTVTVPKRHERSFAAAGLTLKNLTGQHVRVRGTVEERGGPWIEASAPEQIETIGE